MAKRKGQHKSDKEQYGAYQSLCKRETNRKRKLERHLKAHPEDAQAAKAKGQVKAFRNASKVKGNFPSPNDFIVVSGQKVPVVLGSRKTAS